MKILDNTISLTSFISEALQLDKLANYPDSGYGHYQTLGRDRVDVMEVLNGKEIRICGEDWDLWSTKLIKVIRDFESRTGREITLSKVKEPLRFSIDF